MNSHLNIFKTYAKESRQHQLENDLTRALGICLQEDNLFFHEVLKFILGESELYNRLFEDLEGETTIEINIQQKTSQIEGFNHLFAVSLSEHEMEKDSFWAQTHNSDCDPICDLTIKINDIVIIIEAKRDNVDCTAQLYSQVHNILSKNDFSVNDYQNIITPVDLSWSKLMYLTVNVLSFERATGNPSRFVDDFIELIRNHNFRWLPEPPISSISRSGKEAIYRRIQSALQEVVKTSDLSSLPNRLGLDFPHSWANEVLFSIDDNGGLGVTIYPGNTKGQGKDLFQRAPQFKPTLTVNGEKYEIGVMRHIKLSSYSSYFTGLWFGASELQEELYTPHNYFTYTGRKKRGGNWNDLEVLFDRHFRQEFNWRQKCQWEQKVTGSGKTQFDLSFGYEISIEIPFETLQQVDTQKTDLTPLANLLKEAHQAFVDQLLLP